LDLESFYPSKDRFGLAMQLNNLLAAPGFAAWLDGEPLDIGALLHRPDGKPRMTIFSIAHLSDAERMFFVTLLLSQMLGWVRAQSGTTSLRALLYMDEIFGYFPPVANPPSKLPLLTLLKQARAFGVGVVLATQNPVDLDYKGLANTGTWFIGRLQTERDKARVLEGLEGASASAGKKFDRQAMEQVLAGLGNRIFLMNNVHEDAPIVFETRWALSYLRGPLTRTQIKVLMDQVRGSRSEVRGQTGKVIASETSQPRTPHLEPSRVRPMLPPDVPQYFIPLRGSHPSGATLLYQPRLLGAAQVRLADGKSGIDVTRDLTVLAPVGTGAVAVDWGQAEAADLAVADLESSPSEDGQYGELPAVAGRSKSYEGWSKDFAGWLFRTQKLDIFKSPSTTLVSQPGENERDFRVRLQQIAREERDRSAEQLRQAYAPKIAALQDRIRRAEAAVERESDQAKHAGLQAAISIGATVLGAFMGRKTISASTIGKATTAIRGAGRTMRDVKDVGLAKENVAALQRQLADLEARFKNEADALAAATDPLQEKLETLSVKPNKSNIAVKLVALAWTPFWRDEKGGLTPAWE
jgi:hypothetical protein